MKISNILVAGVIATTIFTLGLGSTVSARSSSSRSSSSRSSVRSSTASTHTSTSRPKSWSNSAHYGTGRSSLVGTRALKSKTTPPQAHDYGGKKYNSSQAIYTNTSGLWVYYWIASGNSTKCFDKNHKPVSCDRNSKSYSKDW